MSDPADLPVPPPPPPPPPPVEAPPAVALAVTAPAAPVDPMVAQLEMARMGAVVGHGVLGALSALIGLAWGVLPLLYVVTGLLSLVASLGYMFEYGVADGLTYVVGQLVAMAIMTVILASPTIILVLMGALGMAAAGAMFKRHPAQVLLGVATVPQCLGLGVIGFVLIGLTMATLFHPAAQQDPAAPRLA